MIIDASKLSDLKLVQTHKIELVDGAPSFKRLPDHIPTEAPSVYVWTAELKEKASYEILYVGKAGKGVDRRLSQHRAGILNRVRGNKNTGKDDIVTILSDSGRNFYVFSRKSDTQEIFGQEVSLYSVEEDALCSALRPSLNRAKFPKIDVHIEANGGLSDISDLIGTRLVEHETGTLDDVVSQLEIYAFAQRNLFENIMRFLENYILKDDHRAKLVRSYSGQMAGLNGITLLNYGYIDDSGRMRPKSWVGRIFFADTPRLLLPIDRLREAARDRVEVDGGSFSPLDLNELINKPEEYILGI